MPTMQLIYTVNVYRFSVAKYTVYDVSSFVSILLTDCKY